MLPIQFTEYDFKIKDENGRKLVFDIFRKRWVVLTPEEWVRQNFLQYLVQVMKYPAALIAIEKELMLGDLKKRFDILVYDSKHQPWMMVECKAQDVVLNDAVLQQLLRYNIAIPVPYLVITNGDFSFGFEKQAGSLIMMEQLPKQD
jgi:hypothetical protein